MSSSISDKPNTSNGRAANSTRRLWMVAALGLVALAGLGAWSVFGSAPRAPDVASSGPVYGSRSVALAGPTKLHFAIHPKFDPAKMVSRYQSLCAYLTQQDAELGGRIELETALSYADYERNFRNREPELLLANPWEALEAMKVGYGVIAMSGLPEDFRGLILVRRDGPVDSVAALKGHVIAYPAPTALAACIMPQMYLHDHGLDMAKDVTHRYVGSQDSSIMNVLTGQTDAGATWPPPWRMFQKDHPNEAAQLRVLAETQSLVNNAVLVRDDVPTHERERLRELLLGMSENDAGRTVLARIETARFLPAGDAEYAVVRAYIERFEREVRPVESH